MKFFKIIYQLYFPFLTLSVYLAWSASWQSSGTVSHASSKRTYRSAGTLRRLEDVGISLGAATWHSLFSFPCSLSCSVLTSGCRMFCVYLEEGNHVVLSLLKLSITQRIHQISISDRLQRLTEPLMYLMINTTCTYQNITGVRRIVTNLWQPRLLRERITTLGKLGIVYMFSKIESIEAHFWKRFHFWHCAILRWLIISDDWNKRFWRVYFRIFKRF